jgi:uncharacterized membrane protein
MNNEQKLLAALSYALWPVALIVLVIEEAKEEHKSKQLRYHGFNAMGLWIAVLLLSVPISILSFIPLVGGIVAALFVIAVIIVALLFAVKAYKGEKVIIPYVTAFLRKNIKDF